MSGKREPMFSKLARFLSCMLLSACCCHQIFAQVTLPYATGFDSGEGYLENTALGSPWGTLGTNIETGADYAHANDFSLKIPAAVPEKLVSLSLSPAGATVIFVHSHPIGHEL